MARRRIAADSPQLEFDFGAPEEAPPAPKAAALPRFDAPKNDNERLLQLQWDYRHGRKDALSQMYSVGVVVAKKMIKTVTKNKVALDEETQEEKAHAALVYIISRYLRKDDFVILKSFTAYIYLRVLHELFYRRKVDEIVSFVPADSIGRYVSA